MYGALQCMSYGCKAIVWHDVALRDWSVRSQSVARYASAQTSVVLAHACIFL